MGKIFWHVIAIFLFACNNVKENRVAPATNNFSPKGKKVIVYTTANSTSYRLTITDTLSFVDIGGPVQSQESIFVDPTHNVSNLFRNWRCTYRCGR